MSKINYRKLLKDGKTNELLHLINTMRSMELNNRGQENLLNLATKLGNLDVCKALVEKGVNLRETDHNGMMPLHLAAKDGQVEIVNLLLQNGIDVMQPNNSGNSALFLAVTNDKQDVVKALLENGANVNESGSYLFNKDHALHRAAVLPTCDTLNILLQTNTEINVLNEDRRTPLHLAAEKGCSWNVRRLLNCGAKPDTSDIHGLTPLLLAAQGGDDRVVRLLLIHGASIRSENSEGKSAMGIAISQGHIKVVRTILDFEGDVNSIFSNQDPCLFEAIRRCSRKMSTAWKNPHKKKEPKVTKNEEVEMLDTLCLHGADLNVLSTCGDSALHVCVREGCSVVLRYLLDCGANCQQVDSTTGQTPLTLACRKNVTEAVRILVKDCPVLVNHSSVLDQPPDPSLGARVQAREGTYSCMVYLWMNRNLACIKLLCAAGYRFSPQERLYFEMVKGPGEGGKRRHAEKQVDQYLMHEFSSPWSLQRIACTAARTCLQTRVGDKVGKLQIPAILRSMICLDQF